MQDAAANDLHGELVPVVDAAAVPGSRVARADPANGAVGDIDRSQVNDATSAGGRVDSVVVDTPAKAGRDGVGVVTIHPHRAAIGTAVVDAAAVDSRVGADGATLHRRRSILVEDAATIPGGCVARAGPADDTVGDVQGIRVVDAAAVVGCVGADDTIIHRRRAIIVVDTAAVPDD
ncbi:MAG: hypothetical protein PVG32_14470, partial [Anaerolineales bacterium]